MNSFIDSPLRPTPDVENAKVAPYLDPELALGKGLAVVYPGSWLDAR
jgi:hypothetical protein